MTLTLPQPSSSAPNMTESGRRKLTLERRLNTGTRRETVGIALGMLCAIGFCGLLIAASGKDVLGSYRALVDGAFGSRSALYETALQATPLIFTGLAATVAFNARVWNIGAEGQLFAGAMGAYFVSDLFADTLPRALMLVVLFVGAAVAGGAWGTVPGILKARYEVNEIITTVMLNFVIVYFLSYLLSDVWRAEGTFYYQTDKLPQSAWLPTLFGSRLHLGFLIALLVTIVVWLVLQRTSLGFEIRGVGVSKQVAEYAGVSSTKVIVKVMALSGAIAGLAGASEFAGIHHRLQLDISNQLGFTGIIIALVARLKAPAVVLVAVGAGAMLNGATRMQVSEDVPAALIDVLMGTTLIGVLVAQVAVRYRVRWATT